ncbi:MAG: hypothetical protein E5Y60_29100 [Mesorhizobium sp.]|nr:MAG: hypothetical protein E5Y60_29100 [Mesorhizobium sp.]
MTQWSGYFGLILQGALVTIELTLMGSVLALIMAFLAGLGRLSRFFALRALATAMRHVILPQALLVMLPTFGNNAIELLKATAVVSLISLTDLTFQAQVVRSQTGNTLVPFTTILVIYFGLALIISWGVRSLERTMARGLDGVRV